LGVSKLNDAQRVVEEHLTRSGVRLDGSCVRGKETVMDILAGLRRAARNCAEYPAVIDGETRLTWREVDRRVRSFASELLGLGVQPGERVAILMLNGFRYLELYYAVPQVGALVVPLNYRLAEPELAAILADSGASTLVVDDSFAPPGQRLADAQPLRLIHAGSGAAPVGMQSYEALIEGAGDTEPDWGRPIDEDALVGLYYTGGTTGRAKGVMLSHKNLAANALHVAIEFRYRPDTNYLHVAPMFHLADMASTFAVSMLGGCHTILDRFSPVPVLETVQRERVTDVALVPTMVNAVLQVPDLRDYDLATMRQLLYGASPMPVPLLKRAMELFPCDFLQAYGMTEASPALTRLTPEDHRRGTAKPGTIWEQRLASAGQADVGVDLRVVDEAGKDVAPGVAGEIIARGPNIMRGYWNQLEETAYALRDGWLHTGDLATVDEGNYIYIVDRLKDMIISGGENVYSTEVESAIYAHPAVLEAAVIGVPDPTWGERVHAVVAVKPNHQATADEIVEVCRGRIASYKVPRSIEFVEALPKSGAGKILKRALRDPYWQKQQRRVN
jgi:long-chain acyl-CoA synthetase